MPGKRIKGIHDAILRVDLETGTIGKERLAPGLVERFVGGRGLGAWYLYNEVAAGVEGLDPRNKLIIMTGPVTGTAVPGCNKTCATFHSPLTGTYSYSLCGGHFGPEIKFAGLDGIIVEGKAEKPVYILVIDDHVDILPAGDAWGKTIPEASRMLRKRHENDPKLQMAIIGTAGERLNRFACITSGNYREFGRGGGGAVMGSKNLKAIVVRGTMHDVPVAEPGALAKLAKAQVKKVRESAGGKVRRAYGTAELVAKINKPGFWVTRNFQEGYFEGGKNLEAQEMRAQIVVGDSSCFACPVGCGKRTMVKGTAGDPVIIEGPEFETIGMLGSNCGIDDWETIVLATKICDAHGFDTMHAGGCASLLMEAFEKRLITTEDTDGLELRFGNRDALLGFLEKLAKREGIGDKAAEGVLHLARHFGIENMAIHSKGQVVSVYDPRGCKGMALTYATSPKGAHHMVATTMGHEINTDTRLTQDGKARLQRLHQFSMCIVDSLSICSTMRAGLDLEDQAVAYSLVTGLDVDGGALQEMAERIINLERMYNVRLGMSRKDDTLPRRFLHEPLPSGPSKGHVVDLEPMLSEFYELMGWDQDGVPTRKKLASLGLAHLLDEI